MLKFTKMNGAGNDFVLLDNRDGALRLSGAEIAQLCDRHRGVGADGLLVVEPPVEWRRLPHALLQRGWRRGRDVREWRALLCPVRAEDQLARTGPVSFETQAGVIRGECVGRGNGTASP